MVNRLSTPNIHGGLMSGNTERQESNKAIKEYSVKEKRKPSKSLTTNRKAEDASMDSPNALKEKATFNLPVALLHELEDKWVHMRRQTRSKHISKTLIVMKALELAFDEFDLKNESSSLYSKIFGN